MLTIKIIWPSDFKNYSVYTAKQYVVSELNDGTTQLLLDGETDIRLGANSKTFVMNPHGATIDTIYGGTKPPTAARPYKRHPDNCDIWIGAQQCDVGVLPCSCGLGNNH